MYESLLSLYMIAEEGGVHCTGGELVSKICSALKGALLEAVELPSIQWSSVLSLNNSMYCCLIY